MKRRTLLILGISILFCTFLGLIFFRVSGFLLDHGFIEAMSSQVYLTLIGGLSGYLLVRPTEKFINFLSLVIERKEAIIRQIALPSMFFGALLGLLTSVLFDHILTLNNAYHPYRSALFALVITSVYCWISARFIQHTALAKILTKSMLISKPRYLHGKVLDSSALIDERFSPIIDSHFLEPPFLVPNFVLEELQHIADTSEPSKRQRGRKGLEQLNQVFKNHPDKFKLLSREPLSKEPVDTRLIALCTSINAKLITTDYNLTRVAECSGIRVLNLNVLASAIKTSVSTGDRFSIFVVQKGSEPKQGVGFLPDGTMVVIEGAEEQLGKSILVMVTRILQSETGRMLFAKVVIGQTRP